MKTSLNTQIGGNHYKMLPYQPVTLATKLNFNFIQGSILKYVSRYKNKNGEQDLLKSIHFAEIGNNLQPQNYYVFGDRSSEEIHKYVHENNFAPIVEDILFNVAAQRWKHVISGVMGLLQEL